ncbi:Flp pilus assembly protein TadG [Afipia felis]|uniref:Flp pilus assembly protein TadG n=1 Tax=Afipia felis TaxID=1035 RepID=A0A090N6G1_AFIFE|nr:MULTISPECIES: TadE/TadG family type IV pilus assembly protein [Afipia]EFI52618.1 TadE family protein [Afipia sp. 1NLS2]CEG06793.1 Flp pilus assembly protein TadG [Afipia felis]
MPAPSPRTLHLRDVFRRFGMNRRGSAAVQFAMVAPLFFALLFAIVEVAMMFFATQVLETGTQDTARLLLTHQAQDQQMTAEQIHDNLCGRVQFLLTCSGIYLDVRAYPAGDAFTVPTLFDGAGNATNNFTYQPPAAGSASIVVVRTFYKWPLLITNLGFSLANIGSDKRLISSTTAFRVEP